MALQRQRIPVTYPFMSIQLVFIYNIGPCTSTEKDKDTWLADYS